MSAVDKGSMARARGDGLWSLGNARYIGVDFGRDGRAIECEMQVGEDGTITVLDVREIPPPDPQ